MCVVASLRQGEFAGLVGHQGVGAAPGFQRQNRNGSTVLLTSDDQYFRRSTGNADSLYRAHDVRHLFKRVAVRIQLHSGMAFVHHSSIHRLSRSKSRKWNVDSGRAIYHVGDVGHEVGAGSFLVIPAGVVHYIEPLGTEPVMNLDFFLPSREDYMHLVKYLDDNK